VHPYFEDFDSVTVHLILISVTAHLIIKSLIKHFGDSAFNFDFGVVSVTVAMSVAISVTVHLIPISMTAHLIIR